MSISYTSFQEVAKVYMDEKTGRYYPRRIAAIRRGFTAHMAPTAQKILDVI